MQAESSDAFAAHVLYISYDGMLEPLGESQVVNYVERLSVHQRVTLLSFEKMADLADMERCAAMTQRLAGAGVAWIRRPYHHRPYVTAKMRDIAAGFWVALRWAIGGGRHRIIHARGYIPSLIAVAVKLIAQSKFLFDMRGFWPDERADAGRWPRDGTIYRTVKRLERTFFERADAIVSLTHDGVRAFSEFGYRLHPSTRIAVIPTCVDLARFRPGSKDPDLARRFGLEGRIVFGCLGTISGWYLRREMLAYLALVVRQIRGCKAFVVTREDHTTLRADAAVAGLGPESLAVTSAHFHQMPELVRLIDVGVLFLRDTFSKRASAATTFGEMLASGVPVVINRGGGDASALVAEEGAGLVLSDTTMAAFDGSISSLQRLLDDRAVRQRCRLAAERHFDLRVGVSKYAALYRELLASP